MVDAVSNIVAKGHNVHLTLVGDGPMREEIESHIKSNNLKSTIKITGWLSSEQVKEEIIKARALVMPSFAEGLPVVIMEAMALRRPVISSYVAGIPELIIPNENGLLVQAGNVEALEDALIRVLQTDDAVLDQWGTNAREKVIQLHNIDVETRKLFKSFQDCTSK